MQVEISYHVEKQFLTAISNQPSAPNFITDEVDEV